MANKENKPEMEVVKNENAEPRKMSEIIAAKEAALKKNEDLVKDLQSREYEIDFSKNTKIFKGLLKFLEKDAPWGHTTATGLVMLYANLKEQSKTVQDKEWSGKVTLRSANVTILWTMITQMKGQGFFQARSFIELMAQIGAEVSNVVQKVHHDNQALRDNHAILNELDEAVNDPNVILDVEINKDEEGKVNLADEVDPVVESV